MLCCVQLISINLLRTAENLSPCDTSKRNALSGMCMYSFCCIFSLQSSCTNSFSVVKKYLKCALSYFFSFCNSLSSSFFFWRDSKAEIRPLSPFLSLFESGLPLSKCPLFRSLFHSATFLSDSALYLPNSVNFLPLFFGCFSPMTSWVLSEVYPWTWSNFSVFFLVYIALRLALIF